MTTTRRIARTFVSQPTLEGAGVRLHRRLTDNTGPLSQQEVAATLQPGSTVWFCGPAAWGKALGQALQRYGLSRQAFHQEAFEFR